MAEEKRDVKVYVVDYTCDKCNEGKMRPEGFELLSNPPQYPHICNKCGYGQTFTGATYPATKFE